ncbi:MAG: hypothetical protein PHG64_15095 [Paludibacter sp.]|nr:hypothetical protein [Paludibacter sp.]
MGYQRSYEMGMVDAEKRTSKERAGKTNVLSDILGDTGFNPERSDDQKAYREGWREKYRK